MLISVFFQAFGLVRGRFDRWPLFGLLSVVVMVATSPAHAQGYGGRTHLVSPAMAAAAAINGRFVDIRERQGGAA